MQIRHAHARGTGQTELQMPRFSATRAFVLTFKQVANGLVTESFSYIRSSPFLPSFTDIFWLYNGVQLFSTLGSVQAIFDHCLFTRMLYI